MPENEGPKVLTVDEVARRTDEHPEAIRRKIRANEIFAVKLGEGSRAPWGVPEPDVVRYIQRRDHARRMRESGIVVGYGDFAQKVEASDHPPDTKRAVLAVHDRRELLERVEREMSADPSVRQRLEQLDEADAFEAEAREMAERVRRAERLRQRALELLEDRDAG